MTTYLLVHGAWHGGWCWRQVSRRLRAAGYDVFTPTLTGLGERAHLMRPETGLATHVQDILGTLTYEDLYDVVLVGHSYAGMVISGVAEQAAERLAHLAYFDAFVPGDGQALADFQSAGAHERYAELARVKGNGYGLPPFSRTFGVTREEDLAWMDSRLGLQPLKTFLDPVRLSSPQARQLPRTYIYCTTPGGAPFEQFANRLRTDNDWRYVEIATGHDAMVTEPEQLSRLLLDLAV
jgi:pimeloyl-ACP methyl ester carboxylesterase